MAHATAVGSEVDRVAVAERHPGCGLPRARLAMRRTALGSRGPEARGVIAHRRAATRVRGRGWGGQTGRGGRGSVGAR